MLRSQISQKHIENETKVPTFRRRHIQKHFPVWKFSRIRISISRKVVPKVQWIIAHYQIQRYWRYHECYFTRRAWQLKKSFHQSWLNRYNNSMKNTHNTRKWSPGREYVSAPVTVKSTVWFLVIWHQCGICIHQSNYIGQYYMVPPK